MNKHSYDLVVIGSGPAGEKGAAQAAYFGKRVALIERDVVLGGAGTNTGTLPSKTLRETALMISGLKARGLYGLDSANARKATVREFLQRERQVVESQRERISNNLFKHRIVMYRGDASFVDAHTLQVAPRGSAPVLVSGDVILVATGSSPRRPELFSFHDPRIYDSDTILYLQRMPRSLVVVGGGVIGCEYACMFAALGVEVAIVEGRDILLGFLDRELSFALQKRMRDMGIRLVLSENVGECHSDEAGVHLTLTSGEKLVSEAVLVSLGRVGNTATLNAQAAGIVVDKRGYIQVDRFYRTNQPHVYAAGDVIGFPSLASTSMEQARLAMVHAFDLRYKTEFAPVFPNGIYTIPEVSMAGETEESLQKAGIEYIVGRADYGENARGDIIGEQEGFLKLLFRREDLKLLGVHVIGEIATEIVHIGLTVLMMGGGADVFLRTCYNYPTLGDLYKYATYDAMGRLDRGEVRGGARVGQGGGS